MKSKRIRASASVQQRAQELRQSMTPAEHICGSASATASCLASNSAASIR